MPQVKQRARKMPEPTLVTALVGLIDALTALVEVVTEQIKEGPNG